VTLLADDDHGQVVPVFDGWSLLAAQVEVPFEDVASDDEGAGNLAGGFALGCRVDVDEDRAGALRLMSVDGLNAVQPGAGGGEDLVDAARPGGWVAVRVTSRLRPGRWR